ncbi:MAG: CehA/McbA family metallohydrolase [Clostridia bacterium]|nr:CehA/McbA family metallohydrolase [Clostridia bacterium]
MKLFETRASWHKANLHSHTTLSDGLLTAEQAAGLYRSHGYDVLAVTDHWLAGTPTSADGEFILLGGIELASNSYMSEGSLECWHIVGLGVPEGFRQTLPRNDTPPQALIDGIRSHGGFVILAHPAWSLNTAGQILTLSGIDAVEIWNTQSALPYNPDRADSSQILDAVFSAGMLMPLLASDDSHRYAREACRAATMISTDDFTPAGILSAIRAGKSYATTGPRFRQVEIDGGRVNVETETPCTAACVMTNHPWMKGAVDCVFGSDGDPVERTSFSLATVENTSFIRVTVFDSLGRRAWTNPVRLSNS